MKIITLLISITLTLLMSCLSLPALAHSNTALPNSSDHKSKPSSLNISESARLISTEQVDEMLPFLLGKRVGLVVNQTSIRTILNKQNDHQTTHLVDYLISKDVKVTHLFAPEHGIRGDHSDGERVNSKVDEQTGLPIISLYGKSKRPPADVIKQLDVIIYDIQDVGARFYTYINSLFYMLQAAQHEKLPLIVLDRPNPHINKIDGPVLLPEFRSFVGLLPIPMVYGMTVGELAKMMIGENWLNTITPLENSASEVSKPSNGFQLIVVPMANYSRDVRYQLPIAPSPNLPNHKAVELYPSLCLFEATTVSVGRGTEFPFQVLGSPHKGMGAFNFTPKSIPGVSQYPKHEGKLLYGQNLTLKTEQAHQSRYLEWHYLQHWYQMFDKAGVKFIDRPDFFDKLAGDKRLREALEAGLPLKDIRKSWQNDHQAFLKKRAPYLLYPNRTKSNLTVAH